jgi:hypothetical protein
MEIQRRLGIRKHAQCFVVDSGCGGPQLDFPVQQIHGVAEVWVPFDEVIAVGWA